MAEGGGDELPSVDHSLLNEGPWEFLMGRNHKPAERTAKYKPTTQNLLTDESEILTATLNYNIGVVTKTKYNHRT